MPDLGVRNTFRRQKRYFRLKGPTSRARASKIQYDLTRELPTLVIQRFYTKKPIVPEIPLVGIPIIQSIKGRSSALLPTVVLYPANLQASEGANQVSDEGKKGRSRNEEDSYYRVGAGRRVCV